MTENELLKQKEELLRQKEELLNQKEEILRQREEFEKEKKILFENKTKSTTNEHKPLRMCRDFDYHDCRWCDGMNTNKSCYC